MDTIKAYSKKDLEKLWERKLIAIYLDALTSEIKNMLFYFDLKNWGSQQLCTYISEAKMKLSKNISKNYDIALKIFKLNFN